MGITLKKIRKEYDRVVIDDLSYTFEPGRLYVIKGVSGCGKTTLLNIIGGVEKAYTGSVERGKAFRRKPGYIFQKSLLVSRLTVRENLMLVSGDTARIRSLVRALDMEDLMDKTPEQLSGGERQRSAIVRALLLNPSLILADEPTASLDEENSEKIAALIASLRREGRIIIVATHEHCFDGYADEILHLNYGTIDDVQSAERAPESSTKAVPAKYAPPRLRPFKYAVKRDPKLLRPGSLAALVLAFLLILLISTVQANFKDESLIFLRSRYPMDLIVCYHTGLRDFPYEGLKIYDKYTLSEGEVNAYHLLDKKDSVLAVKGMIEAGAFPKEPTDILVSQEFVKYRFGDTADIKDCVGQTIDFAGLTFKITGVLADLSDRETSMTLMSDVYYQRSVKGNAIFIPYETIKTIGVKQNSEFLVAVYDNLAESVEVLEYIRGHLMEGQPNQFYTNIERSQYTVDQIAGILFLILGVSYATSCIFMVTIVYTDLFSRKRELGYLQIFGVSKLRVFRLVMAEYVLKVIAAVLAAGVVYALCVGLYFLIFGRWVLLNLALSSRLLAFLFIVYLAAAGLASAVFLRKSAIDLIT